MSVKIDGIREESQAMSNVPAKQTRRSEGWQLRTARRAGLADSGLSAACLEHNVLLRSNRGPADAACAWDAAQERAIAAGHAAHGHGERVLRLEMKLQ